MTISDIEQLEEKLRLAMLASDTEALDDLISDRLLFVGLDGANISKETDLAAHRAGTLRLTRIEPGERHIELCGAIVALVNVAMNVSGIFAGQAFSGLFRYTRVWRRQGERVQIIAGQMCVIQNRPD